MESVVKLIDYLRNNEFTEVELHRTYERFLKKERFHGFEQGCDFLRGILGRRRSYKETARSNNFKLIIEDIEDFINEKEDDNRGLV